MLLDPYEKIGKIKKYDAKLRVKIDWEYLDQNSANNWKIYDFNIKVLKLNFDKWLLKIDLDKYWDK